MIKSDEHYKSDKRNATFKTVNVCLWFKIILSSPTLGYAIFIIIGCLKNKHTLKNLTA